MKVKTKRDPVANIECICDRNCGKDVRQKSVYKPLNSRSNLMKNAPKKAMMKLKDYGQMIRYAAVTSSPPDVRQMLEGLSLVMFMLWMWIKDKWQS